MGRTVIAAGGLGAIAAVLVAYLGTRAHPCDPLMRGGWFLETAVRLTRFHEHSFERLPETGRKCMWDAGAAEKMPINWMSYINAARTMFFEVQSRYTRTWQEAQSYWLEKEVEAFLGVMRAQYVSTGTAALVVALQALEIGLGDEVIVPTYTWVATASAVAINGGIPVLVDIDNTLGMDPNSLRKAITNRTKAIIAVHINGVPCDIHAIRDIAVQNGLFLIEDVAQAFGATVYGQKVGSFGTMGITSVNPSKTFQAGGQGGIVWTNNLTASTRMGWAIENGLAPHGGLQKLPSFKRSSLKDDWQLELDTVAPFSGHCFRSPSEWHAAFLRSELQNLPAQTAKLVELKMAFMLRLKPEHQRLLQRVADPLGDRSYTIALILRHAAHPHQLSWMLREFHGISTDPGRYWKVHYLPNVEGLLKKVSFHPSGFPWLTKEEQQPIPYSTYDVSTDILNRTILIQVSWYYSRQMMTWAADRFNEVLDLIAVCGDQACPT